MDYQVAVITGAGSGLGRELALALSDEGTAIAGVDISDTGLSDLEAEVRRRGKPIACRVADVTRAADVQESVKWLEERLGPVDLLVACAGIGRETSALQLNAADVAAVIDVNLVGVANSVAAVLPGMLERRCGHVAAISSLASLRGLPRMLGYCASKAGLNAFLEGLRVEVRPYNLYVSTICPGWVRTPMTAPLRVPMPGLMEPDVAARRILRALHQRRRVYAFPPGMAWRLRLLRWLPSSVGDRLIARMLRQLQ